MDCSSEPMMSPNVEKDGLKDSLLPEAVTGFLETLLDYLHIRNKEMALHVASQPWNRLVLLTLLSSSEETGFLQPAVLKLMTLFVRYESRNIVCQHEINHILQESAKLQVLDLPLPTYHALHLFLIQLQNCINSLEPEDRTIIQTLLEQLQDRTKTQSDQPDLVYLGGVAVSLSHVAN
uniref:Meiosis inhibitor protein 1 n=1 Tax=Geotrypetes seraphini TaxID=260995 RepID=A0A6P8Q1D2_GEOSA|nr:meiosis inhibitor protein 1 [Geotrypetes seraphini]